MGCGYSKPSRNTGSGAYAGTGTVAGDSGGVHHHGGGHGWSGGDGGGGGGGDGGGGGGGGGGSLLSPNIHFSSPFELNMWLNMTVPYLNFNGKDANIKSRGYPTEVIDYTL
ncbi:hypothetical protein K469DRAFT_684682 [Zopfia rhizophila CBS 207.26]|uniref:Uncharacterized protein n=1 Tax=Zopfia rhizophila CBS 207.26 TaxID=1314779 RepID=A0A6A6E9N7_9PEZI|nr:hypothetical protein K469DRAFT_684682 [Zopfia rhizophila CBS 207.26]